MEEIMYYHLDKKYSYYVNVPDKFKHNHKYLAKFEEFIYSNSFNIIGIHFNIIKCFNEKCLEKMYLYVYKDKMFRPNYPLKQYFNNDFFEEEHKNNHGCKIYRPNYELLFVNSIVRQVIGDPYFSWEFI